MRLRSEQTGKGGEMWQTVAVVVAVVSWPNNKPIIDDPRLDASPNLAQRTSHRCRRLG